MALIIKINPENPEKSVLQKAAELLRQGGIVVYPTDTLYGLGASITSKEAMDRLFRIKGRGKERPVSLMINSIEQLTRITGPLKPEELRLTEILFPGKITLITPVRRKVEIRKMEHLHRIGFRIPDYQLCHSLVKLNGAPITTTSANIAQQKNLNTVQEIAEVFENQVDLLIDAGPVRSNFGSSVLDISFSPPVLAREGDIPHRIIEKKIGYKVHRQYPDKYHITFICTGNICRSPMAVGILRRALEQTKYRKIVHVDSAGTLYLPSTPAALEAIEVSEQMGIDIGSHLSKPLTVEIVLKSDLIICLALNHYQGLVAQYPAFRDKIFLLKQWDRDIKLINPSVADPIGHNKDYFQRIFNEIEREIQRLIPEISRRIKEFIRIHPNSGIF